MLSPAWVSLLAASLVFVIGSASLAQKARNDRRDAWWKRAQWAIDKSLSDHEVSRNIGSQAVAILGMAAGTSRSDLAILLAVASYAVDNQGEDSHDESDPDREGEDLG